MFPSSAPPSPRRLVASSPFLLPTLALPRYFQSVETDRGAIDDSTGWPAGLARLLPGRGSGEEKLDLALSAVGGCISYLTKLLLDEELVSLGRFVPYHPSTSNASDEFMVLDGQTLRNLDVSPNPFRSRSK